VATAAAAAPSVTPLAGERVHPRVCASPSSGLVTAPLGGGRSERIRRAGKVGCSKALPGTRCLRQRWIRCGGALGRLPSHYKRRPGALPVSGVEVRLSALILRVRDAATIGLGLGFQPLSFV
jgi:hypothetical protein